MSTVRAVVGDRAVDRVAQVDVPVDHVVPGGGVGVLEVRHEAVGARVERVDRHLAVGGAGDLHPALLHVRRDRGDPPVALTDLPGLRQEVEHLAVRETLAAFGARFQQLRPPVPEFPLQLRDELEGVRRQHLLERGLDRAAQLELLVGGHVRNLSGSPYPSGATGNQLLAAAQQREHECHQPDERPGAELSADREQHDQQRGSDGR